MEEGCLSWGKPSSVCEKIWQAWDTKLQKSNERLFSTTFAFLRLPRAQKDGIIGVGEAISPQRRAVEWQKKIGAAQG